MDIFKLLLKTFPVSVCKIYKEVEMGNPVLSKTFDGVLQQVSSELSLEFNGGISHNLYCSLLDLEDFDIEKNKLEGYNYIEISNERFEIIRTQKVDYKEGGHFEILLNKNAS